MLSTKRREMSIMDDDVDDKMLSSLESEEECSDSDREVLFHRCNS